MRLRKYAAAAMAATMTMSMLAHGAMAEEVSTEGISEEVSSAEEGKEEAEETVYPVTVENSDGTEVVIEKEPETVVSLGPNITELMYTLDAGDKLVARTIYCDYPEEAAELPTIGSLYEVDVEAILALEPDLVVASTHISEELMEQLTDAGITVMYLYEEHEISGVYDMIETLGTAVNKQGEAEDAIDEMREKLESVEKALDGVEPVSIYYVVGYGEYGDYTAGGDTFINGILEAAGTENIAADVEGWSYSVETLLDKDPDFILVPEYSYEDFISLEPYTELSAVKAEIAYLEAVEADTAEEDLPQRHVLTIDNNMLDRQCARNADAVLEIAQMLYPEYFTAEEETVTEEASTEEAAATEIETE